MKKRASTITIIWRKNAFFFHGALTIFTIGLLPFLLFDKVSFFISVKQWHHPIVDCIAPYLTWLGDGFTYGLFISVITLFGASCRKIIIAGSSFVCMSIIVQILKRLFFAHYLRPISLVPTDIQLHVVNGVEPLTTLSFPSGHAGTIFTLISVIQLFISNKKKIYSIMLLFLAIAVAYSRIYLFQHFYTDVYVGGIIGITSSTIIYIFFIHFQKINYLDNPVYLFIIRHVKNTSIKIKE
ncbi:phosphatase PAP2 family protein [Cardinium endosymbiont of Culicoides punctatus]|uniref:phosphatase PAP2 family protein n=1 Tax=Cardinium endosymbiont of Culicoides punctatus TaxID=2304601 RepID=UPI001058ECDD|nr:phosphatase PAP2 family protein [Cardinium endosymbiont of Culicoides punctatus]TDG95284.1 hypothetical protein CCPUN_05380 [Cardinium endosymbiont of Culicoides punctatus]